MERTNKKRIPKWVRVTAITLCVVLIVSFLPSVIAFAAKTVAKNMHASRFAGGYEISDYIGEEKIEDGVYIGRKTVQVYDGELVYDYYFSKKWYNAVLYDIPWGDFEDYRFVCATIDENGKIERMEMVGLGNTSPELYEKASTLYGEQKSEITCGSITLWACNWWKIVIVLIDLAIDWI